MWKISERTAGVSHVHGQQLRDLGIMCMRHPTDRAVWLIPAEHVELVRRTLGGR